MRSILIPLLFFTINVGYSNIDSLKRAYNAAKKDSDLEKQAILLKELSSFYYFKEIVYDSSIHYAQKAIPIFKHQKDEVNLAMCYKFIGYSCVDGQNYKLGIAYLDSALPIFKRHKEHLSVIQVYSNLGIANSYVDKPQKSLEFFQKALVYCYELGDSSQIGINTLNLGIMYSYTGNYTNAIQSLLDAKKTFENIGDSSNLANVLLAIGDVYDAWDKNDLALKFYLDAKKLKRYIEHKSSLVSLYDVLGKTYIDNGEQELGKGYFYKALKLSDSIDYKSGIAQSFYRLGDVEFNEQNYLKAKEYFSKSLKIEEELGSIEDIVYMQTELGRCYLKLQQYSKAKEILQLAEQSAQTYKMAELEKDNAYVQFKLYKSLKQYETALLYFENYKLLEDSIYGIEHELKLEELREKYEAEKKEHQIETLNGEKKLQAERLNRRTLQFIALAVISILLATIGVLFYLQRKRSFQNKQLLVQQKLFRSQMNPHFMFNALNAIKNFTLKNKGIEAADYIVDFSRLMRLILESSAEDTISLKDEINLLESYLKLQQLRFQNSFHFSINIDEEIDIANISFPPMLLQPFIENAVEHGIKGGGEKITLQISQEKNNLLIQIKDDGPGIFSKSKGKTDHKSRAVAITKERISTLKKTSNWEIVHSIKYLNQDSNELSGTLVIFTIPIRLLESI